MLKGMMVVRGMTRRAMRHDWVFLIWATMMHSRRTMVDWVGWAQLCMYGDRA